MKTVFSSQPHIIVVVHPTVSVIRKISYKSYTETMRIRRLYYKSRILSTPKYTRLFQKTGFQLL
jgi:hypothetical protein